MQENTLSCIIVDDEPMALALLENYVQKTPFLSLQGKFSSAIEAVNYLRNNTVEVVYTDIQMPDLNGIELSHVLPKTTKIIFTTAFDQYAIEGFKVDALDYLLKPFNYEEFLKATLKAQEWFKMLKGNNLTTENTEETKKFLFVKSEYKQIKIALADIELIEGLKDYAKIWLKNNPKAILTLMSLKKIEEELPKSSFMRIHRSYIISLDSIEAVERSQVILRDRRITVSEQYKEEFQTFINNNSL